MLQPLPRSQALHQKQIEAAQKAIGSDHNTECWWMTREELTDQLTAKKSAGLEGENRKSCKRKQRMHVFKPRHLLIITEKVIEAYISFPQDSGPPACFSA